jgi:hypothetical protein
MFLQTTDGVALLGYAGLGATALGTEPADWMSRVLRGRNLPLEQSLGVLAEAVKKQLPRHLIRMPPNEIAAHHVIVPAFLHKEPRLYSIDMVLTPDRKDYRFRYTRHVLPATGGPPRIGVGGSSALRLIQDDGWMRDLVRVVRANERGNASSRAVADYLARLNSDVAATDELVGSRCIVARRVPSSGGEHWFYTGTKRDASTSSVPSIARGMDMHAFFGAMMPHFMKFGDAMLAGKPSPELDRDEVNAALARLPRNPDENLH